MPPSAYNLVEEIIDVHKLLNKPYSIMVKRRDFEGRLQGLASPFTSCVTLGKLFKPLNFSFLICKMKIVTVPTSTS